MNDTYGNTYVIDIENGAETARLMEQDRIITQHMGQLLPTEVTEDQQVLDVACGPGGWALQVAFAHPEIEIMGIDLNKKMIDYARAQARVQGLNNVSFAVMDVTKALELEDASFDVVNARFLNGFLLQETWPGAIHEMVRVLRPGGLVRLTECDSLGVTNSPAFEQMLRLLHQAWERDTLGRVSGITPLLGKFLQQEECQHIHEQAYVLNFSVPWGDNEDQAQRHLAIYNNLRVAFSLLQPYLLSLHVATNETLSSLYGRILIEMMMKEFRGLWYYTSVVGQKPI